jgi:hypothetical protein
MQTLNDSEEKQKILRHMQYRIAQKFSAGEDVLCLLAGADVATCLYILEQIEAPASQRHLYH